MPSVRAAPRRDPTKAPAIDEQTLRVHHDKHHAGYVKGLNATLEKLEQARVQIVRGDYEFNVTLGATLFEFRNVRPPKTAASVSDNAKSDEEMEGLILERIFLFEELTRIVNDLFRMYLNRRMSESWKEELAKIRIWVHQAADNV